MPLELEFTGNFFNLADFFHQVKRFVKVANQNVRVSGRLLTVEGVRWSSDPSSSRSIRAEMKATIYLSPKAQGVTAGATPGGPVGHHAGHDHSRGELARARRDPDRHRDPLNAMKTFISDLWSDLREKRLWPVAVLLLAGLVAVPVVLKKSSEDVPPAPPTAAAPREAPEPRELKGLATVKLEEGDTEDGSSLDTFDPANPFRPPAKVVKESEETDGHRRRRRPARRTCCSSAATRARPARPAAATPAAATPAAPATPATATAAPPPRPRSTPT